MDSLLEIVRKTETFLAGRGIEDARAEAEWLVAGGLGLRRLDLYLQFQRPLTEGELTRLRPLVKRRAAREPLQYILGETEFHGLRLRCDRRALIPRPETEELVERVIQLSQHAPPRAILDIGTGTGAIALALAQAFAQATITATDISAEALALAQENAALNDLDARMQWLCTDGLAQCPDRLDLIVSNPPYLDEAEYQKAMPEVRDWEPTSALTGGYASGLEMPARLLREARPFLNPHGLLAMETGIDQHEPLSAIATQAGWSHFWTERDLSRKPRFFFARKEDCPADEANPKAWQPPIPETLPKDCGRCGPLS